MKTIQYKTPQDEALYNAICNVKPTWHEFDLPDHPIQNQFNRKLVVKGFLDAPKDKYNNEVLNVFVSQILTLKSTGDFYKEIPMKTWEIFEHNLEVVTAGNDAVMVEEVVTEMQYDEEGNELGEIEISRTDVPMKVPSIKLIKFLLKSKNAHLVDVFEKFMGMYVEFFAKEVDDI